MLSIVYLVVSDYRAAVGSDLNASQGVSINIIALYETSAITKYVNAPLVSIEDSIAPRRNIQHTIELKVKTKERICDGSLFIIQSECIHEKIKTIVSF